MVPWFPLLRRKTREDTALPADRRCTSHRILAGEFAAGRLLPSESGLGSRYDASRVTIRRALEQLRDEGLLASRQGLAGTQAATKSINRSTNWRRSSTSSPPRASRPPGECSTSPLSCPGTARAALGTDRVLAVRRLNLADGEPFAGHRVVS